MFVYKIYRKDIVRKKLVRIYSKLFIRVVFGGDSKEFYIFYLFFRGFFKSEDYLGEK